MAPKLYHHTLRTANMDLKKHYKTMVPIVKTSASHIKDSQYALEIFRYFNFLSQNKHLFTMDIASLHIVIPNDESLRALKHFFDQRTVKEPSSGTLLHQTEPVLTLKTNGVAMRPSHAKSYRTPIFQSIQRPQRSPHRRLHRRYLLYQGGAHSVHNRRRFLSSSSEIYLGNFRHFFGYSRHQNFN